MTAPGSNASLLAITAHTSMSAVLLIATEFCAQQRNDARAMYGRRPRCKRNLTFQRSVRVQPCIRPVFAWRIASVAMQPLWPLALM